jgi:hypothetical protein
MRRIMKEAIGQVVVGTPSNPLLGAAASNPMDHFWKSFWKNDVGWLILWIAVAVILTVIAYYVVRKIRPKPVQKEHEVTQWLAKYRELHSQGELTDEEFRTIKTQLAELLQDELNTNGEKG